MLEYYTDNKEALPAYYYFKQRNKKVLNFLMKDMTKNNFSMKGDVNVFFKQLPIVSSPKEQLDLFSEIDKLFKRYQMTESGAKNTGSQQMGSSSFRGNNMDLRNNDQDYCFEMKLANQLRQQKYNVEEFLLKNNFFNRSNEEVEMIYKALKDPDNNQMYLDALGLTDVNVLYRNWVQK